MLKFRGSSARYMNRENLTVGVGFSHFATFIGVTFALMARENDVIRFLILIYVAYLHSNEVVAAQQWTFILHTIG